MVTGSNAITMLISVLSFLILISLVCVSYKDGKYSIIGGIVAYVSALPWWGLGTAVALKYFELDDNAAWTVGVIIGSVGSGIQIYALDKTEKNREELLRLRKENQKRRDEDYYL